MSVRFLHLSDLDLGAAPAWTDAAAGTRSQEMLETFRDAVTHALDPANRIDGVLVAGNLFERHRPPPEVWSFVRGLFGRLAAARKPVILVPGSRDSSAYKDSVYRTERFPGVDLILEHEPGEPLEREVGDHRVFFYGVSPRPGATETAFRGFQRKEEEGIHVGLINGAVPDLPEWNLRPHDLVVEPGALSESGMDYVALGGYHGLRRLELAGTTAAYSGTLEARGFEEGDLGRKDLLVVTLDPGSVQLEQIPFSRKTVESWELDLAREEVQDSEALIAALLARASDRTIARVTLTGPLEFLCDLEEVAEAVRPRYAHLELVDRTDLLGSSLLRRIEGEGTIRGHFVRRMLERIDELQERAGQAPHSAPVHRELEVSRTALRLGLEQFLQEEPVERLFAAPAEEPGTRKAPSPAVQETAQAAGNGRAVELEPVGRTKALLRVERHRRDEAAEAGEES